MAGMTSSATYVTSAANNGWGTSATTNTSTWGSNSFSLYTYEARYSWSKTGKRCSSFIEPKYNSNVSQWGGSGFATEDGAWNYFRKQMNEHVNFLINKAKELSVNTALEKRLKHYNNLEALETLQKFQDIVKSIPEIK